MGSWQTEHWAKPGLFQTHTTGHWEDQRRKCKTFSARSVHPLRKPGEGCPSSLCTETTFCSPILSGPLKDGAGVCSSVWSSAQAFKLLLLVTRLRDVAFAPGYCIFPQRNPHSFRSRTLELKTCKGFMWLKARPSQKFREGRYLVHVPTQEWGCSVLPGELLGFTFQSTSGLRPGSPAGGSSVDCREGHSWGQAGPLMLHRPCPPPDPFVAGFGGFTWTTLRITLCS